MEELRVAPRSEEQNKEIQFFKAVLTRACCTHPSLQTCGAPGTVKITLQDVY